MTPPREDILSLAEPVLWQAWRSNDWEAEDNPDWVEFDDEESARAWGLACLFNGVRPLFAAPTPPAAEAPGQEPVFKSLEWEDDEGFPTAKGLFGHYIVHPHYAQVDLRLGNGRMMTWGLWSFQGKPGDGTDILKAEAQKHYEESAASALVSAPPTSANAEAKKSDRQIVDEVNDLARTMLRFHSTGYEAPAGHKFYAAQDTRSRKAWQGAVEVYEQITGSEVHDALLCLDDDEPAAIRSLASPAPKGET